MTATPSALMTEFRVILNSCCRLPSLTNILTFSLPVTTLIIVIVKGSENMAQLLVLFVCLFFIINRQTFWLSELAKLSDLVKLKGNRHACLWFVNYLCLFVNISHLFVCFDLALWLVLYTAFLACSLWDVLLVGKAAAPACCTATLGSHFPAGAAPSCCSLAPRPPNWSLPD